MNPPGRFLKEDPDGAWFDIGDHKAIKKVGQALREDASDVRDETGSSTQKSYSDGKTKKAGHMHDTCDPIKVTIHPRSLRADHSSFPVCPTKSSADHFGSGNAKHKSAAVEAALEESGEMAFGRVFYPPPTPDDMELSIGKTVSLISGLSVPSQQSFQQYGQISSSEDVPFKAKNEASYKVPSSLASMSINSGSISMPPSLLSDLSESLLAMDISEPLPIDHSL